MKIDIDVPINAPFADQLAYMQRAEALDLDGVAVGDDPSFGQDAFVTLAAAALQTERLMLYPASTNPITRHPAHLAASMRSLHDLAPGRVKLGIAAGDSGVAAAGAKPASVSRLRDAIVDVKARLEAFGFEAPPPIMVTASGPRTLAMAGEVGDEVLASVGLDEAVRAKAEGLIDEGRERSGDPACRPPITYYTLLSINDDEAEAVEHTRYWVEMWLRQGMLRIAIETLGLGGVGRGELPFAALRELSTRLFLVGAQDAVGRRLEALATDGVAHLLCMVPGGLRAHQRAMEALAKVRPGR